MRKRAALATQAAPKILFIDIETFPQLAYVWGNYEQNVLAVKKHSIICAFSAKWLNGPQITKTLPDYKGYNPENWDDRKLVADLWALLDEANIATAQNGDEFDFKKINTRIAKHKLGPPSPYQTIDTLKIARKVFGFPSNKLDDLAEYLGIGRKLSTGGFSLWLGCMAGDKGAWRRMRRYNAHDVRLLHDIYLEFLPWINNHPNHALYTGKNGCPKCGSDKLQSRGLRRNATTAVRQFQCMSCHGWCRETNAAFRVSLTNA
jgi:hypothetical protein